MIFKISYCRNAKNDGTQILLLLESFNHTCNNSIFRLEAYPFHCSIAVAEQLRENDRTMRKTQRDLTRDRGQLEKEEKRIVSLS